MAIRMTGINSGLDTDSIVQALVSSYSYKKQKYEKAQTKLSWTQEAWKSLNTKVYSLYTSVSNFRFNSGYSTKKTAVSDPTKATVTAGNSTPIGTQKLNILKVAQSGYLTGGKLDDKITSTSTLSDLGVTGDIKFDVEMGDGTSKTIELDGASKISDVVTKLRDAGLNASFDNNNHRFFVSSNKTGKDGDFTLSATNDDANAWNALTALGLNSDLENHGLSDTEKAYRSLLGTDDAETKKNIQALLDKYNAGTDDEKKQIIEQYDFMKQLPNAVDKDAAIESTVKEVNTKNEDISNKISSKQATKIDGQDAEIKLNGVTYTGSSNNFSVNGLSITATGETGDGDDKAITISTSTDVQGIYDSVKDFLQQYNTMVNELQSLYNADSAKGYEPLTDEEKEEMSDGEIEKWESKIKDSLLRRDNTLGGVMNAMTSAMSSSFSINGKSYSLSSFGINTLGYFKSAKNENYAYHIDGDSDDSNTSGNADKLMAAIQNDPDTVIDFMKQLSTKLYNSIGDKMSSTTLSSAYTIYNDKQMSSEYNSYKTLISKWETMITEKEDYYYKKFSKMESALATLNSTQSSMSGFFG